MKKLLPVTSRWINSFGLLSVLLFTPNAAFGGQETPDVEASRPGSQQPSSRFQATSRLGQALMSSEPSSESLENLAAARRDFEGDPRNLEKIIWYGRRTAYTGDYRRAIQIYTDGLEVYPNEPRLYRHRGHRLISTRRYEESIRDLERARELIGNTTDQVEQDGLPNAMNIPVSSLHGNIRYHLGLAYYLSGQFEKAVDVYRADLAAARNDDQIVSTTHWLYTTLRRLGHDDEARVALEPISDEMTIIENHAYHRLCLLYQDQLAVEDLVGSDSSDPANVATLYGVAAWYGYTGHSQAANELLQRIVDGPGWPAFGYAAAEADLEREAESRRSH